LDAMSATNYPIFILAFLVTGSLAAVAALRASPRVKRLAYQVVYVSCIGVSGAARWVSVPGQQIVPDLVELANPGRPSH
jgi:hypothetical protein